MQPRPRLCQPSNRGCSSASFQKAGRAPPGPTSFPTFVKNQATVDEELFHDIIPFIQTRYNISDEPRERAIAGLSMGGLQAMETGIAQLVPNCINQRKNASFFAGVLLL